MSLHFDKPVVYTAVMLKWDCVTYYRTHTSERDQNIQERKYICHNNVFLSPESHLWLEYINIAPIITADNMQITIVDTILIYTELHIIAS